nr:probable Xaa-Pro aminopeptidase P [Ipomoea batatas]
MLGWYLEHEVTEPKDVKRNKIVGVWILDSYTKNPVEMERLKKAHIQDGAAVVQYLVWLDKQMQEIYGASGYFIEAETTFQKKQPTAVLYLKHLWFVKHYGCLCINIIPEDSSEEEMPPSPHHHVKWVMLIL